MGKKLGNCSLDLKRKKKKTQLSSNNLVLAKIQQKKVPTERKGRVKLQKLKRAIHVHSR
jgi:hypothetical protein